MHPPQRPSPRASQLAILPRSRATGFTFAGQVCSFGYVKSGYPETHTHTHREKEGFSPVNYKRHTEQDQTDPQRDIKENRFGQSPHPDEKYDDIADISKITTTIPDDAPHRNIDKIVLGANSSGGGGASVKTAIVSPPTIYGPGRGPGNTRSIQAYDMAKWTLQNGFAPVIETGLTEWDQVHVHDLADLFVKLVDAATSTDASKEESSEIFGEKGYHFAENGAFTWGDVAKCEFIFSLKFFS